MGRFATNGACRLCPVGKYQDERGALQCKWCGVRDFALPGRTTCLDQCPCPTGQYGTAAIPDANLTAQCVNCEKGFRCGRYTYSESLRRKYNTIMFSGEERVRDGDNMTLGIVGLLPSSSLLSSLSSPLSTHVSAVPGPRQTRDGSGVDIDGDGFADDIFGLRKSGGDLRTITWFQGDARRLQMHDVVSVNSSHVTGILTADVDGDGRADILFVHGPVHGSEYVLEWSRNAVGRANPWESPRRIGQWQPESTTDPVQMAMGDVDGNGRNRVVVAQSRAACSGSGIPDSCKTTLSGETVLLFTAPANTRAGNATWNKIEVTPLSALIEDRVHDNIFATPQGGSAWETSHLTPGLPIFLSDVDADGDLDIVLGGSDRFFDRLLVIVNDRAYNSSTGQPVPATWRQVRATACRHPTIGNSVTRMAKVIGPLDMDGSHGQGSGGDVLVLYDNGDLQLCLLNVADGSNLTYTRKDTDVWSVGDGGVEDLSIADIDNDGDADLLVYHKQPVNGTRIWTYVNDGGSSNLGGAYTLPGTGAHFVDPKTVPVGVVGLAMSDGGSLVTIDLDNDGYLDLVHQPWTTSGNTNGVLFAHWNERASALQGKRDCWEEADKVRDPQERPTPVSVYCEEGKSDAVPVPAGYISVTTDGQGKVVVGAGDNPRRRDAIRECPAGSWCLQGHATACAPGKYTNTTGETSCEMCAPGKYARKENAAYCDPCPEGYQCPRGAIEPVKCGCEAPRESPMNALASVVEPSVRVERWYLEGCRGHEQNKGKLRNKQQYWCSNSSVQCTGPRFMKKLDYETSVCESKANCVENHPDCCAEIVPLSSVSGCLMGGNVSGLKFLVEEKAFHPDGGIMIEHDGQGRLNFTGCGSSPPKWRDNFGRATSRPWTSDGRLESGLCDSESFPPKNPAGTTSSGPTPKISFRMTVAECPPGYLASPRPGDSFCPSGLGSPDYPPMGTFTSGGELPFEPTLPGGDTEGDVYFNGGMLRTRVSPCPTGHRCKQGRKYECPVGFFANGTLNPVCTACAPGLYVNEVKQGACIECPLGWYQNTPAETGCTQCSSGQYATGWSGRFYHERSNTTCRFNKGSNGTYEDTCDHEKCRLFNIDNPLGTWRARRKPGLADYPPCESQHEEGSEALRNCVARETAARKECEKTIDGYCSMMAGRDPGCPSKLCFKCPKGYFQDDQAESSCKACVMGRFASSVATAYCEHCAAGQDSNGTIALASECTKCDAGRFRPDALESRLLSTDCDGDAKECREGYEQCMPCSKFAHGCGDQTGFVEAEKPSSECGGNACPRGGDNIPPFQLVECPLDKDGKPDCGIARDPDKKECVAAEFAVDGKSSFVNWPVPGCPLDKIHRVRFRGYIRLMGQGGTTTAADGPNCDKKPYDEDDRPQGCKEWRLYNPDTQVGVDMATVVRMLRNRTNFYAGEQCASENDAAAKCVECKTSYMSVRGLGRKYDNSKCQDEQKLGGSGGTVSRMVNAENWVLKSFLHGTDGDDRLLRATLTIPSEEDHAGLRIVKYGLEIGTGQRPVDNKKPMPTPVCPEGQLECPPVNGIAFSLRATTEVDPTIAAKNKQEGNDHQFDFLVRLPTWKINPEKAKIENVAPKEELGMYSQTFWVRAYPIVQLTTGEESLIDHESGIEMGYKVMTDAYPKSTWKTIRSCESMRSYIETRDDADWEAGKNVDNPDPSTWRCMDCPLGGSCSGYKESHWRTLSAKYGWWRARTANDTTVHTDIVRTGKIKFYKCPLPWACLGRKNPEEFGKRGWGRKNLTHIELYGEDDTDPALKDHTERCMKGYTGITCGNCYDPLYDPRCVETAGKEEMFNETKCPGWDKHFMKKGGCTACPPGQSPAWWVVVLGLLAIPSGAYVLWKLILKRLYKLFLKYRMLTNDVKRTLGMLLDFLQVLNSISSVLTIEFPPILEGFLDQFAGIIAFDIKALFGLPCIDAGNGIAAYVLEIMTPVGICFIILLVFGIQVLRMKGMCPKKCGGRLEKPKEDTGKKASKLKRKSMAMIKQMQAGTFNEHSRASSGTGPTSGLGSLSKKFGGGVFSKKDTPKVQASILAQWWLTRSLLYQLLAFYHVPICSKTFNMFRCETIEDVDYLNMDYNIPCWKPLHLTGIMISLGVMLGYVFGLPGAVYFFMFKNRKELRTPRMQKGAGYLFAMFQDRAWYFACVAMARKIVLAGALIVLYRQPVMQITIGIIYCALLLIGLQHVRPFRNGVAQKLTTVSWLSICLIYTVPLARLAMDSSPTPGEAGQKEMVDNFTMAIVYGTFALFLMGMVLSMRLTWMKFQAINKAANFDPNDYAWLYEDEKQLKSRYAKQAAEAAKKSHEKRGSIFGNLAKNARKSITPGFLNRRTSVAPKGAGGAAGVKRPRVTRMPSFFGKKKGGNPWTKGTTGGPGGGAMKKGRASDAFGLAGLASAQASAAPSLASRKLPDHLVKRIAERRERRASMASHATDRQQGAEKIMRRRSFDASAGLAGLSGRDGGGFGIAGLDMGGAKDDSGHAPKRRNSLNSLNSQMSKRGPSKKMLEASLDMQSTAAGDLMIVQPRRKTLNAKKFHKMDPFDNGGEQAKKDEEARVAAEAKIENKKRFKVFMTAAGQKGYFAGTQLGSHAYRTKYLKLVKKYLQKYQGEGGSDSSSSDEDDERNAPRAIMLRTQLPVVNAFGAEGQALKGALLASSSSAPKYTTDTMTEI